VTLIRSFPPVVFALTSALVGVLFLFASPGFAQEEAKTPPAEEDGPVPYIEYMVGVSIVPDQTLQGSGATGSGLWGRAEQDSAGYFVGGAVGARFLEHFRTEMQFGFRSTEVKKIAVQPGPRDSDGDLSLFSVMANGYVDWDLGVGVIPFIGAGIGWGMPRLDAENNGNRLRQLSIDDTDSVFVWNAMLGGTLPISEVAELSLGYRYVQTEDIKLKSTIGGTGQRVKFEYDAHEVYLGLRFNF